MASGVFLALHAGEGRGMITATVMKPDLRSPRIALCRKGLLTVPLDILMEEPLQQGNGDACAARLNEVGSEERLQVEVASSKAHPLQRTLACPVPV
jgi:hypothetical protein